MSAHSRSSLQYVGLCFFSNVDTILMNQWKHSNWGHLSFSVSSSVRQCAFFHTMVMKDKDQILGNSSPSSSSVCEVQAYPCNVVSRFTLLIWCVIWRTPSLYKLNISSVNMHLVTKMWPTQAPRAKVNRKVLVLVLFSKCSVFVYQFLLYWWLVLCVTERDEATIESSDQNATSFTEVDKRVKRRLLMGNN